jgi:hypothetical protein
VLGRLAEEAPGARVTLHGHPDPWITGASPGLTVNASKDVDAVLVPAWPTHEATADQVAAVRGNVAVEAYVTVLPPADPAELPGHVRRMVAAGATGLGLYHLGLAPQWRQPLLRELVELAATLG